MSINAAQTQQKLAEVFTFLEKELASMRAGRANIAMLDNIRVEAYGQKMPINQLANVSVVDASLITVKPWDKSTVDSVRKAINESDLGINAVADGDLIRLPIPPMTEERRVEYVKLMKAKLEEAKIAIRQVRKEVMDSIEADKKNIGEDELERQEKDLQKHIDEANKKIEDLGAQKEKELLEV